MPTPAANVALIVICLLVILGIIGWIFKTQVNLFVKTLLDYRNRLQKEDSTNAEAEAPSV
jgi:predicted PurR-regulated permease PerM